MQPTARPRRSTAGFSFIELMVTLVVLSIAMVFVVPAIRPTLARVKLESATRQTAIFCARARLEAIKTGNRVIVHESASDRAMESFADVNADGVFNPTAGAPRNTTDYIVGRYPIPNRIEIAGPGTLAGMDGLTVVGSERLALFLPDGSIADIGAIRLADDQGEYREIRIEPKVTPRAQIRYWDGSTWVLKKNPTGAIR